MATPVLTALALYYFGLGGGEKKERKAVPSEVKSVQPVEDSDLRTRQAELEHKIAELSESKKETVQSGIAAIETRRAEAERAATPAETNAPNINGYWYDPSTGSAYNLRVDGDLVTLTEYTYQVVTAYGQGTLRGRHVDFEFYSVTLGIRGRGSLEVTPEGDRIALTVVNPINGQRTTSDLQRTN
ncbi:MAG TPA: hypothetical protein VGI85_06150 [Chthoniobacterales bacterium]